MTNLAYLRPLPTPEPEEIPLRAIVNVAVLNGRNYSEVVGQIVGRSHCVRSGMTYSVQGNGVLLNDVSRDRIALVRMPQ